MFYGHVLLLTLSNILVQYPFKLFGLPTTWGAFTYPLIFILTDLTTRLKSAKQARKIIFQSMFPGLIISYFLASYVETHTQHWGDIFNTLHIIPLRIASACFVAYVLGQLMDIFVFQQYRNTTSWWVAPLLSMIIGNVLDTTLFFAIAFYHSTNSFLSHHWVTIASVDICFKIIVSIIGFIPLYGVILNKIGLKLTKK